ncbi:MAG: alpha/beta hydrolase fold domain-containing protein [Planctomycetota bacterium]
MRILIAIAMFLAVPALGQSVTPPGQPDSGPGGSGDYVYDAVKVTSYGEGADRYWVFEPDVEVATPLPIVLYVHGLNAITPAMNRGWINHLVRRGAIVIYPAYQTVGLVDPRTFTDKAAQAAVEAIARLNGTDHARGDTQRFALAGHSLGGTISANLAAAHAAYKLPKPKALMSIEPGDTRADQGLGALLPSLAEDHTTLPRGLLMLVIAGEEDGIVGIGMAKRIFNAATQIPDEDKDFLVIRSDRHGRPALVADHFIPASRIIPGGRVDADALDYYGLWKPFDALMDAAFHGRNREYALGNTPEQRYMGTWSDGKPVIEMVVTDEP